MLSLEKIDFSYAKKGRRTLRGVSCALASGRLTGILGPNGSGKTTLVKIMAGLLRQDSGRVNLDGRDAAAMSLAEKAALISYVPQKTGYFPDLTVTEAVMTGRKPYIRWAPGRADRAQVAAVLEMLGLEGLRSKNVNEISGGEFQKTLIAQALVKEPRVLLFDEPLNNLDIANQLRIMAAVKRITAELGLAAAIVIHDVNMAVKYCDDFLFMKEGSLHAAGGADIISAAAVERVFGVPARIETFDGRPAVLF